MRNDDWLADVADLSTHDLRIVIRSELGLIGGEIYSVSTMPALFQNMHEALPACS
jgi:hypothetical protein